VVLTLVLVVSLVVAFIVAIFVTFSARSAISLAVAALLAFFAYPLRLMAGAYGKLHKAFPWRVPTGGSSCFLTSGLV
jgi:hypothetical protein